MKHGVILNQFNEVIANVTCKDSDYGRMIIYSYARCENINANRDWNLVNAKVGKLSFAKKYREKNYTVDVAIEINPGEFYI